MDVLVNSAEHIPNRPLLEITDQQWHAGMDAYFTNIVKATRWIAPVMIKQRGGSTINISTAWVFEPSPIFSPTSAVFRAGLSAYTKLFSDQYAKQNVRMNNVLPGRIDTLPTTEERRLSLPMMRYGTGEEVAATIAFLALDDAAYITGQSIRIDGGLTRSV